MKTPQFTPYLYIVIGLLASICPIQARADTQIPDNQTITNSTEWTTSGSPYIVSHLSVASTGTLTIDPGVIVKFMPQGSLSVSGSLFVGNASSSDEVTFTDVADSSVGGNTTNMLGITASTTPEENRWNYILVNNNATGDIHHADFRYGGGPDLPRSCMQGSSCWTDEQDISELSFEYANVFIADSTFEEVPGSFFNLGPATLSLTHDRFDSAIHLARVDDYTSTQPLITLVMHDSSINNVTAEMIRVEHGNFIGNVTDNWWGDSLGPHDPIQNPAGDVPILTEYYQNNYSIPFVPWLTNDIFPSTLTASTTPDQSTGTSSDPVVTATSSATSTQDTTPNTTPSSSLASNVLFLPGMLESRLYMRDANGNEKRVWEPIQDSDISLLSMGPDGASDNLIYTRDIMDQLYSDSPLLSSAVKLAIGDQAILYAPFEKFMDGLVQNGTIKEWKAYPYDWRYDVNDIVQNGTLVGDSTGTPTRVYLQDVVQELASSSPTGKVTIVAHSGGGLLAKALAIELQKEGKINLLDRIIMVGTPQFGTPGAIGVLLHGDGQTHLLGLVTYSGTARAASKDMAGAYDLLPSTAFLSEIKSPLVTFDPDQYLQTYIDAFGQTITGQNDLRNFLIDTPGLRNSIGLQYLRTPEALLYSLMEKVTTTHDSLDTWTPPASLAITSIVGWGQNTVSGYDYSSPGLGTNCLTLGIPANCGDYTIFNRSIRMTTDGDGMVVAPSAAGTIGQALYFNTQAFQKDGKGSIAHQSLLSAEPVQNQIVDTLRGLDKIEPYLSTTEPAGSKNPLTVISAHSPVNILLTDPEGNQSGIVPVTGLTGIYFTKEGIPGSSVQVLDDEKYIYVPDDGQQYTLSVQGYDTGPATLDLGTIDSDGNASTTQTIPDIAVTATTSLTYTVNGNKLYRNELIPNPVEQPILQNTPTNSTHGVSGQRILPKNTNPAPIAALSFDSITDPLSKEIAYLELYVKLLKLEILLQSIKNAR